jgi:hypothetical protein
MELYRCQNCEKEWLNSELKEIDVKHLAERVAPGEPMPQGECPACGALCHLSENTNCLEGKRCPECLKADRFRVSVRTRVNLYDDGSEEMGDIDYDAGDWVRCEACDWEGTFGELTPRVGGGDAPVVPEVLPAPDPLEAKVQVYLAKGELCPWCGSDDLGGTEVVIEGPNAFQDMSCGECGKAWHDCWERYDLVLHEEERACE